MLRSLRPRPEFRTARGVANTGGGAGQGSRKRVLALTRTRGDAFLLMRLDRLRNLAPLIGLEIDHVGLACGALFFHHAGDRRREQPPPHWQEHERTQKVGNKARQDQENPADRGGEAWGFKINGSDSPFPERAAEAVEVPPARVAEYQDPGPRGCKEQQRGPQPPDGERHCHKNCKLCRGEQNYADKGPFHQGHRALNPASRRLAPGPVSSMVRTERWPCRRTHWIGSVACLHNAYILTREPAFAPQIGTLLVRPWVYPEDRKSVV